MSRPLHWILAIALGMAGCTPPGKPTRAENGGVPDPGASFSALFAEHCQGCHGKDGTLGPAPPLNDPLFLHIVPDEVLEQTIANGRPNTPMPAHLKEKGGGLSAAQVKALAKGLKETWSRQGGPANPPPYALALGGDASRGATLFAKACARCHGPDGRGGDAGAIHVPAFLTLCSDPMLHRIIITGRPDLGMPNFTESKGRPPDFRPFTAQDAADLTALLASWRKESGKK